MGLGRKHTIQGEDKSYLLNFGSYATMNLFRKYGTEGIANAPIQDICFDMIKWGLCDNGRIEIKDPEVVDVIDDIGGVTGDNFLVVIRDWVIAAISTPEVKKKEAEPEVEKV